MELGKAMHALGRFAMIINPCSHWSQFQFTINYIFIDLQPKQCCNDTGMRELLLWGLVLVCVRQVFIAISLVVYSQFSMKMTTVFYVNISLSSTVPGVWNWLWTCTTLFRSQLVLVHGFVWKGRQFRYTKWICRNSITRTHATLKTYPNTSYF